MISPSISLNNLTNNKRIACFWQILFVDNPPLNYYSYFFSQQYIINANYNVLKFEKLHRVTHVSFDFHLSPQSGAENRENSQKEDKTRDACVYKEIGDLNFLCEFWRRILEAICEKRKLPRTKRMKGKRVGGRSNEKREKFLPLPFFILIPM